QRQHSACAGLEHRSKPPGTGGELDDAEPLKGEPSAGPLASREAWRQCRCFFPPAIRLAPKAPRGEAPRGLECTGQAVIGAPPAYDATQQVWIQAVAAPDTQ